MFSESENSEEKETLVACKRCSKTFLPRSILIHIGRDKLCKAFYGERFDKMKKEKNRKKKQKYRANSKNKERELESERKSYSKSTKKKNDKKKYYQEVTKKKLEARKYDSTFNDAKYIEDLSDLDLSLYVSVAMEDYLKTMLRNFPKS